ncbi:hypothetical protein FGB62_117g023 [Gracilaria domingensis]|nr:hypothetical protein FGB62_117g023 [Gracilaria domingensis]
MDDGNFSRLSLFTSVSYEIHRRLLQTKSENAKIVLMDSTQFREQELMVSVRSNYVLRSLSRGTSLRYTDDKQYVWVKPLHTFLVLRLETGSQKDRETQPYICAEHISIERTAGEMAYPIFFVSDEDKAFTAAATWVFNRMYVSEYGALMLLSAQRNDDTIRLESVRTTLVHCTVHKSRNLRKYIQDVARERKEKIDDDVYSSLNRFVQQLFAFLRSADSYQELCHRIGAVSHILSTKFFPYVTPGDDGRLQVVVSADACVKKGGEELWRGLTPNNKPPPPSKTVHRVRLESRLGKEQLNWETEVQLKKDVENEDETDVSDGTDPVEPSCHGLASNTSSNSCETLKQKGLSVLLYGKFKAYVKYGTKLSLEGVDRLLIYFNCPFLSGFGYGRGGFKMLCSLSEAATGELCSPLWVDGGSFAFFRSSVFGNAVFLFDAVTGKPPLTHNTSVEVAIRNRKHVDEIGVLMKSRSKGISLPEYVSRRAHWIDTKNRFQLSLMVCGPFSARRRSAAATLHDDSSMKKRRPSRLTDIARNCDVDELNEQSFSKLFEKKLDGCTRSTANNFENIISNEQLPSTQLSLSQERLTESIWKSSRGVCKAPEIPSAPDPNCSVNGFLKAATEKLHRIMSPFGSSEQLLSQLVQHIRSRTSEQYSTERVNDILKAVVNCDSLFFSDVSQQILLDSWFSDLETSTVWKEGMLERCPGSCELLPFVQLRISSVKDGYVLNKNADNDDNSDNIHIGDVSIDEIRVLVAPKLASTRDSKLPPRIMDTMTSLYCVLSGKSRRTILISESHWLPTLTKKNIVMSRRLETCDLEVLKMQSRSLLARSDLNHLDDVEKSFVHSS